MKLLGEKVQASRHLKKGGLTLPEGTPGTIMSLSYNPVTKQKEYIVAFSIKTVTNTKDFSKTITNMKKWVKITWDEVKLVQETINRYNLITMGS